MTSSSNAQQLLDTLARIDPGDALVLSIYLDLRPQVSGERPGLRTAQIVLKDRLREIEKTLLPRGKALDDFRADAARVDHFFEEHAEPWLAGVALFACHQLQLFASLESGVPFDDQVVLESKPDLFQLARLIDEYETAVVALVDTATARLFVSRRGFLHELAGPHVDTRFTRRRQAGGLNQKRYQRRVESRRLDFAREMAEALEELVMHEGATQVILAGDAVAIPLLHQALSPELEPLVSEQVLRLDIRTPRADVAEEIAPLLAQIEADESHSVATRLIDAVREQGLGVLGTQETRDALTHGQAETLVLADEAPLGASERSELVQLASHSGAGVETVAGHTALDEAGGVGALLRYRVSWVH
jgi:peptide chain release factor subunit 1